VRNPGSSAIRRRCGTLGLSEKCIHISDERLGSQMPVHVRQTRARRGPTIDLKARILDRMRSDGVSRVWTPNDFLDLGSRAGVDKALQRLAAGSEIRRIDRGLYDLPRVNQLTGKPTSPDYTAVIDAVARRDKIRLLLDGITAANQLGLTTAVPGRVPSTRTRDCARFNSTD
jgi:hypothetical protein